ncbi:MAG: helix-turn-helix domain-containing protein [Candidatus Aquicultor sp.]
MNRLKELLKPKVTYKDIADRYGCTISFVGHVAEGRSKPPAKFKLLVSEMLGLPVTTIFPENGGTNNAN